MAHGVSNAGQVIIPTAGHGANIDQRELVNHILKSFLEIVNAQRIK